MRWDWLKHAFAVDGEPPLAPTPAQAALVDKLCRLVVDRGLAAGALVFLESARPLGYVSAQAMHFFAPLWGALGDPRHAQELAAFMEHRGAVEYVCQRIEALARERRTSASGNNPA